jgi:hypothetical protein
MWKQKSTTLAAAAIVAGLSYSPAVAQDYYGDSGYYDQYGADQYGAGQYGAEISFDYFYDALAPHGQWFRHPRWGDVWRPVNVSWDFRPYYQDGYWQNTLEFGWTWVSDYAWGDIAFHYGRWVHDPYEGWIWVPGYVWAPSWVIWRSGGGYLGWFPMPPTHSFLLGIEIYHNDWRHWDQSFGYASWYGPSYGLSWSISQWVFVDERRFGHRHFHRWVAPRHRLLNIVHNTTNITNYVTENNYIVNRSLRGRRFDRAGEGGYEARPAREVLRRDGRRTRADAGRQIHQRERAVHGGNPNASARERLAALPRGERPGNVRAGNNTRNIPRADGRSRPEQTAPQPRVRNENVRPQRPRREQTVQPPRVRNENARPQIPRREQTVQQPRARNENARPQRPRREQTAQQPRMRNENVRPQLPRREQTAQQPRVRNENARPQRLRRDARPSNNGPSVQRANPRPRAAQTARQPRTIRENVSRPRPRATVRPARPQRAQAAQPEQRAQSVQRAERPRPAAVERQAPQRANRNPPQGRQAAQARSGVENTRPERPGRGRRNRGG